MSESSSNHRVPMYEASMTSTFDLGSDSGSDNDLSNEAKRIMRKKKKEREKLNSLGPLVPMDSEDVGLAASQSRALPLPLRNKLSEMSVLTTASHRTASAANTESRTSSLASGTKSNLFNPEQPRVSKSVAFGTVQESHFHKPERTPSNSSQPSTQPGPSTQQTRPDQNQSSVSCPLQSELDGHYDLLTKYLEEQGREDPDVP